MNFIYILSAAEGKKDPATHAPPPHSSFCLGVGGPQPLGGWLQLVCLRLGGCNEQSLFGSRREEGRSRCCLHHAAGGEGALTPGKMCRGRQELVLGQERRARWVAQHQGLICQQGQAFLRKEPSVSCEDATNCHRVERAEK